MSSSIGYPYLSIFCFPVNALLCCRICFKLTLFELPNCWSCYNSREDLQYVLESYSFEECDELGIQWNVDKTEGAAKARRNGSCGRERRRGQGGKQEVSNRGECPYHHTVHRRLKYLRGSNQSLLVHPSKCQGG